MIYCLIKYFRVKNHVKLWQHERPFRFGRCVDKNIAASQIFVICNYKRSAFTVSLPLDNELKDAILPLLPRKKTQFSAFPALFLDVFYFCFVLNNVNK